MAASQPPLLRILCLDGGGVRGLASLLILDYVMKAVDSKNPPKPCDFFDMIGGTSTGGLIAIMLGRLHMTVKDAIDAYLDLSMDVFAPKHKFNKLANLVNALKLKGLCSSVALEAVIKAQVEANLGEGQKDTLLLETEPKCHVCVCALRGEKRSLVCFRNYSLEGKADLEPKIWEAARATSAATLFFDPITIGRFGQTFVDGAGGYNNPIEAVYDEAVARWNAKPGDFSMIVSIGTGMDQLTDWGKNFNELRKTLSGIATETDTTAARFVKNHAELESNPQRLFRFQVAQGLEKVGLAEHEKINEIASATQIYMEEPDREGTKQLKAFKELVIGGQTSVSRQPHTAYVSCEQAQYIKRYAAYLDFKPFDLNATKYAMESELYGAGTLSLPERFVDSPKAQVYDPRGFNAAGSEHSDAPIWWHVLQFYASPETCSRKEDSRRVRLAVGDCNWVLTDLGSGYAPEVRVADLWRILASFNPRAREYTHQPNTETSVHVCDLWISVPTSHRGRPVVFLSINPNTVYAELLHEIPTLGLATAICGGRGLEPDQQCGGKKLYGSEAPDWSTVKFPLAMAFATIPPANRCFFMEQYEWAKGRLWAMIRVCHFLWDHADAIDLDESGTPVKVLLETMTELIDERYLEFQATRGLQWRAGGLMDLVQGRIAAPSFLDSKGFVEIEDAVTLLEKSGLYTKDDEEFWDNDGLNHIVDDWWGCFGERRAKWIALLMMLTLLQNMNMALLLPESFNALFHSPTGTCIISP
ncbi:hypothetical protein FOXG_07064 [Fusarium oxysporum f. sp. lycopersici 4287]|uniref:PNPLA domain-containing protein n=2 Tax=Fusarium oxysporum TaxID=5507 RepID=A0A0J9V641_FUSO4|nr:hypothetical protein FOXG_07064 [Fusarium oxysporum f. sp. lycopersici 4287]KAJ9419634.1 acyl transferase/acyl hydrolase/lysophospholipase [Fusarium oxysporum]KNB06311.1 hypothetical protein FOXG_07064 [Fusarium oxysporum f. sp. lycopersici 4287]